MPIMCPRTALCKWQPSRVPLRPALRVSELHCGASSCLGRLARPFQSIIVMAIARKERAGRPRSQEGSRRSYRWEARTVWVASGRLFGAVVTPWHQCNNYYFRNRLGFSKLRPVRRRREC